MKALSLLVLASSLFTAALFGATHKIEMSFDNLTLKNGKVFGAGQIKSYDRTNGKVVIQADRQIVSLQLEMLPMAIEEKILAMVPKEEKEEAREAKDERKQNSQQAAKLKAEKAKASTLQTKSLAEEQKAQAEAAAQAQNADRAKYAAKSAAVQKAGHYFRYEYKPGSGSSIVIRQSAQVDEPVEVAGWANRYRVSGTIGLAYYDSHGRSFNNAVQNFEVLVQCDERGNAKVIDFTSL